MKQPARSYIGKLVDLYWDDAFDDEQDSVAATPESFSYHSYGRVVRETPKYITVATSEGSNEKSSERFHTTSVLWSMVNKVTVLS